MDCPVYPPEIRASMKYCIKFRASTLPNSIRIFFNAYYLSEANYITILRKGLVELIVPKVV